MMELPPQPVAADYDNSPQLSEAVRAWERVCVLIIEADKAARSWRLDSPLQRRCPRCAGPWPHPEGAYGCDYTEPEKPAQLEPDHP